MFTQYRGSEKAPAGSYFCLTTGNYTSVPADGVLPGGEEARYIHLNVPLMLILGPITGLVFVLILPLMAPVFLVWIVVRAVWPRRSGPRRAAQRPIPVNTHVPQPG